MPKLTADYLRGLGLKPEVVVDVGVWQGTPWLYDAWPDAHFVLVDPQGEAPLIHKPKSYEFHAVAAGCIEGECAMIGSAASVRTVLGHGVKRVWMRDLIPPGNFGLKVDAEGDDVRVIVGAAGRCRGCLALIAEVPRCRMFGPRPNGPLLSTAADVGMSLYELFDPDWKHDRYRNALFLPDDSPLFEPRPR